MNYVHTVLHESGTKHKEISGLQASKWSAAIILPAVYFCCTQTYTIHNGVYRMLYCLYIYLNWGFKHDPASVVLSIYLSWGVNRWAMLMCNKHTCYVSPNKPHISPKQTPMFLGLCVNLCCRPPTVPSLNCIFPSQQYRFYTTGWCCMQCMYPLWVHSYLKHVLGIDSLPEHVLEHSV